MRTLYAEHAGPLLRYALHLTSGDRQRAEDIVQETLLRAWLHPDAIAERPARPWLFAVARNLAVDAYRARRARPHEVGETALELVPAPDQVDRALESWAVADVCRNEKSRFLSVRVISDAIHHAIPEDIDFLIKRRTTAGRIGAAAGAILRRPSSIKDMWQLKEDGLVASDRLARFLIGIIGQLPKDG